MISGVRQWRIASSPRRKRIAEVPIQVRGCSALTATPRSRNPSAMPITHIAAVYLAIVLWRLRASFFRSITGGEVSIKMCGFSASSRCGRQVLETMKVPRAMTSWSRSKPFNSVSSVVA